MGLTEGIHRAVAARPHSIALVDGLHRYSWQALALRVARIAGYLKSHNLVPGGRCAYLGNNTAAQLEFTFATLWAGGVIVPINNRWTGAEIQTCLEDCEPQILVYESDYTALVESLVRTPDISVFNSADEAWVKHHAVDDVRRHDEDLAALYYTGGTTGKAKGVMLSHGNLLANARGGMANMGIDENSVHLHVNPLFHVAGASRVFTITEAGGTHVMLNRFSEQEFFDVITREQVSITVVVPTMLNRLVQFAQLHDCHLNSLRLLTYGASPMPRQLIEAAMACFPNIRFLQSYGMTELSPVATVLFPAFHVFEGKNAGKVESAGQATNGAEVQIHGEQDEVLLPREVGEVCVRGPTVMQGYWRQPELTAITLRGGWMHTGDLGYLDADGFLFLVDRLKDMIITGGENVFSVEVENVLYSHENVHECAVIGIPSEVWGEAVHAFVVPKFAIEPAVELDPESLIKFCRQRLAAYKCPKSITVVAQELPKSGAGKILKTELRVSLSRQNLP